MIPARRGAKTTVGPVIHFLIPLLVISQALPALPRLIAIDDIAAAVAALRRRTEGPLVVAIIAVVAAIVPAGIIAHVAPMLAPIAWLVAADDHLHDAAGAIEEKVVAAIVLNPTLAPRWPSQLRALIIHLLEAIAIIRADRLAYRPRPITQFEVRTTIAIG